MVYINGIGSISIQGLEKPELPDWGKDNYLRCSEPDFSKYISPILSRRMSKIIKRSIVASKICLEDANVEMPDAIISGTGLGCIEETEKFLLSMIEQHETLLQPTHFIQSTHNTISSQIAMNLKCNGYNSTYSHLGSSFESALLDAYLQIELKQIKNALVGGFDEMTPDYKNMLAKNWLFKNEPFLFEEMRNAFSSGSVIGEGSNCVFISADKTDHSYTSIMDVKIFHTPENYAKTIDQILLFLDKNNIDVSEIDAVMLGLNGDINNDIIYDNVYRGDLSIPTPFIYKHLCGEYFTASAFGLVMMAQFIKNNRFSNHFYRKYHPTNPLRKVLFHNHYHNKTHSLILLGKC